MNPGHPANGGKAKGWQMLGYDVATAAARERAAREAILTLCDVLPESRISVATYVEPTEDRSGYHRATTRGPFTGLNGHQATLVAAWQRNDEDDHYDLLTIFVRPHKGERDSM